MNMVAETKELLGKILVIDDERGPMKSFWPNGLMPVLNSSGK
jgi:hypothetical protein